MGYITSRVPQVKEGGSFRIGIDVTAAVTQGGGIGRYTRELVRALASTDASLELRLFTAKRPASLPVPHPLPTGDRITLHEAPLDARWLYRLWHRLRLPLPVQWLTGQLDLFHSPDFVLPPVGGGIPTLLTVHDLSFMHYPETFTPALINYLTRAVPHSAGRATHILADSEATRRDLLALWGVPDEKISVLYSGVDARFRPINKPKEIAAVRRRYALGEAPYLLSISTIQPRKNYQMLIRAFKQIASSWPHNLIIGGGQGWLYEQVYAEVEKQELADRVQFIGFVADDDLPALYSGATLFLFPSLYEGFGLPILEAMACGVPALVSNASSLPEVAGEAALLLPPQDQPAWSEAMHQLLLDAPRRMSLVAAGYHQARRFTWRRAAEQLIEIYHGLLTTQ